MDGLWHRAEALLTDDVAGRLRALPVVHPAEPFVRLLASRALATPGVCMKRVRQQTRTNVKRVKGSASVYFEDRLRSQIECASCKEMDTAATVAPGWAVGSGFCFEILNFFSPERGLDRSCTVLESDV